VCYAAFLLRVKEPLRFERRMRMRYGTMGVDFEERVNFEGCGLSGSQKQRRLKGEYVRVPDLLRL